MDWDGVILFNVVVTTELVLHEGWVMWAYVDCCLSDVLSPRNISPCADNAAMTEFVMSGIAAFICELISSDVELAFVSVVWTWSVVCTGIFGLILAFVCGGLLAAMHLNFQGGADNTLQVQKYM
jgi:hypothetical protein